MRTASDLYDYQKKAVNIQCTHAASSLWLDMGLGKSVITLISIAHLLNSGFLRGVLIVAPIRVCRLVWRQEALKWDETKHLTFSMVMGNRDRRTQALLRKADVYLINYENLKWLSETLHTYYIDKDRPMPFDGIVFDEISKCKNSTTQRVKSLQKILKHFTWRTGLTGTPASNGYADLHGQYLVLDDGERLGTSKTAFRNRFYYKSGPYKYKPHDWTEGEIQRLIGDITLQMSAEDYNPLPDLIVNDVEIALDDKTRKQYDQLEKEFFFFLDSGEGVEVFNAASLTNKLLQFSNGAVYPIPGMPLYEPVHDLKLEALEDIIEEANGQQVLCSYAYRSDAQRIMKHFSHLDPINLTDCKSESSLTGAMARWKAGDCPLMIGHPACVHPRTQVLTELRGWVKITDVTRNDRVFDGVEFVGHDGRSYAGHKTVITRFGITATPDHKFLVDGEWVELQHVEDNQDTRRKAVFRWEDANGSRSIVPAMRSDIGNAQAKRQKTQRPWQRILSTLHRRRISPDDRDAHLANMAGHDEQAQRHKRSEALCRSWDTSLQRVARLQDVLQRHVRRLLGRVDHRADRRARSLLQRELQMGYQYGTASQQAYQSSSTVSRRTDSSSGTMQTFRFQQDDAEYEIESRHDRRRGGSGCSELTLRKRPKSEEKSHVYDLVNCGPRHRFVIRNDDGEMFIVKNSMGHGIDGLQEKGHILVWFGLNWSLDLYEQFNARVRRQGQGAPVICHRLLTQGTMDQVQAGALDDKATTQNQLRKAIKRYRESKR